MTTWTPTAAAETALARAQHQSANGPQYGRGECQLRTRELYGAPSVGDYDHDGSPDAEDGWKATPVKYRHPTTDVHEAPRGAIHYWGGGSHDNGHVAPAAGSGKTWSTDIERTGFYDLVDAERIHNEWGLPYLGWAEVMDGVPAVTAEPEDDVTPADIKAIAEAVVNFPIDNLDASGKKTGTIRLQRTLVDIEATQDKQQAQLDRIEDLLKTAIAKG